VGHGALGIFPGYHVVSRKILHDSMGNSHGVDFARSVAPDWTTASKGGEVPVSRDECEDITKELQSAGQAEMAFPESFDKFLTENLNDRIRKKQDEFDVKKAERKKLHDVQVLKHAEKWRRARLDLQ